MRHPLLTATFLLTLLAPMTALAAIDRPVNDRADLLATSEQERLATRLVALRELTGATMTIVLEELDAADATRQEEISWAHMKQWGLIAQDRGILLHIIPSTGRARLEVGWDVELTLSPSRANTILLRAKTLLQKREHFEASAQIIEDVAKALAGERYVPPPPSPPDQIPETTHASTSWTVPDLPLLLAAASRAELPAESWIKKIAKSTETIHDHEKVFSPSWRRAMIRRLAPIHSQHKILIAFVTCEYRTRHGESLARHTERIMRRWLQLHPGPDRVLVALDPHGQPRIELRTSVGLANLYTPLRIEGIVQEALKLRNEGAHLEASAESIVNNLVLMASRRHDLERDASLPLKKDAPAKSADTPQRPPPTEQTSVARTILRMVVAFGLLALCTLCLWVAWRLRRREPSR